MANDPEVFLTEKELARLAERVERLGEVGAAETLRLSRTSVLRLMCKRPVRLGTVAMARIGLAKAV
jgi:hypothetical protein